MNINSNELAYIAGFFDGEGCIRANTKTSSLMIAASNTVKAPIEFIKKVFGGAIYERKYLREDTLSIKVVYRWVMQSEPAVEVLEMLLPYLIVKRKQAMLGIQLAHETDPVKKADISVALIMSKRV